MGRYRNVGTHTEDLADGRTVPVGEYVELSDDEVRDPRQEDLIARGVFIGADDDAAHEADLAERRVKARAKNTTEEE